MFLVSVLSQNTGCWSGWIFFLVWIAVGCILFEVILATKSTPAASEYLNCKNVFPLLQFAHLLVCTHGFVCSFIMLACEQTGCYLNWRFINRPVYCLQQAESWRTLSCTKKKVRRLAQTLYLFLSNALGLFQWRLPMSLSPLLICGFICIPISQCIVLHLSLYSSFCFARGKRFSLPWCPSAELL